MDNYGIAAYQEVNPGLFAIVTFPFLFAVMFGDIGHGFLIFIAALYMILSEKRLRSQPMGEVSRWYNAQCPYSPVFLCRSWVNFSCAYSNIDHPVILNSGCSGRYIILLMGAFSMYTGLMYNDIFSKSLHLWHSGWTFPQGNSTTLTGISTGHTYPFGVDPGWHGAENALVFTNSYKMKMSVILGVTHASQL